MVRSCPVGWSIGGALLAALLVTGCGAGGDDAAASPSGVASSASGPGGSPGPLPASSAERPSEPEEPGASDEYVPASLEGPAQNVPEPVMPELAKEESREGAQAFLDYWSDAMWYAYQTGDTSYAREIISPHCAVCIDQLNLLEEIYDSGAWAVGGREVVRIQDSALIRAADGVYKPVVMGISEGAQLVENGRVTLDVPPQSGEGDAHLIFMDYSNGRWIYISAANLAGAGHAKN